MDRLHEPADHRQPQTGPSGRPRRSGADLPERVEDLAEILVSMGERDRQLEEFERFRIEAVEGTFS